MNKSASAVVIFIRSGRPYLLVQQKHFENDGWRKRGRLSTPGGHSKQGFDAKSLAICAQAELHEESGLNLFGVRPVYAFEMHRGPGSDYPPGTLLSEKKAYALRASGSARSISMWCAEIDEPYEEKVFLAGRRSIHKECWFIMKGEKFPRVSQTNIMSQFEVSNFAYGHEIDFDFEHVSEYTLSHVWVPLERLGDLIHRFDGNNQELIDTITGSVYRALRDHGFA
jgi:ADP-ribose pyrophosphatase YjhB (NUDIX family)